MASYGLEAANQPLEEAASQLSLDSLQDHKNAPYSSNFSRVRSICHEVFALQPTVSGKLMAYQLPLTVNQRYYTMTIRKFYCGSTLICPIRRTKSIFWKAENRQAIDSYDDSECNSGMLGEGSYRFSF